LAFSFFCLHYIFHCQPCHISLWQPSTNNFWHPRVPVDHILSSLKNTTQILIAFHDVRWALSSADFSSGRNPYRARSNQWTKDPSSRPIQDCHHFSTQPRTNTPFHFPTVVPAGASRFTMSLLLLQHSTFQTLDHIWIVCVQSK
jgi:hypothetical protein